MNGMYGQFEFYCQKVLPLVYDDELSYYEVLQKVVDYLNKMMLDQNEIIAMVSPFGEDFIELKNEVSAVEKELEKVKNGGYVSLYLNSLANWIDKNLQEMVSRIVKFVAFGIDENGNFYADVPSTWQFLTFDTIVDVNSEDYGHLILTW